MSSRTEKKMEREQGLPLMEEIMLVNGRMVKNTVKAHTLLEKGNGKETSI